MELKVNSVCNAVTTPKAVDFYRFESKKGQRIVVDCASRGIDSKLDAVLVVADAAGRDIVVERRTGVLDFSVPEDGTYVIKVHELTYNGGQAYYYRLGLQELASGAPIVPRPTTKTVNSFSWPPAGLSAQAATAEVEPNNSGLKAQKITLPCDISGSFFPAADVDFFEFEAKKGDIWWVEVASERFGLPTDPSILVQHVAKSGDGEKLTDVAEFSDIPSPVKVSSNGYAYDGPPYNAGSSDILGKLLIKEDGTHRLQLTDLFGGTRNDPRNIYRLIVRKATPDFAIVSWALHMELRNGDRNALSKPLALRGGATMALEVVAIRRDGFDGDIELAMDGLPPGVTAQGLKIPAGKSHGVMVVTASQDAPRSISSARLFGTAKVDGKDVVRPCSLASMAWPIHDSWGELPSPRLLADVPVSVSGVDLAPLTIASAKKDVWEVVAGEKLTIPLTLTRRSEFSGATMHLKTFGAGFDHTPQFELQLTADSSQAVLDLAKLKTPSGDYLISFYGGAVAKYRHHPEAVKSAEESHRKAQEELKTAEEKAKADPAVVDVASKKKAVDAAAEKLKRATATANPNDIVDIVVSEPIAIRVKPAEKK